MILTIISFSVVLFIGWVIFANTKKYTSKEYPPYIQAPAFLWGFIFGVGDVIFNATLGVIVFDIFFGHMPKWNYLTLSERMTTILAEDNQHTKRWKFASFICKHFVEPWDWNHCGLAKLILRRK